MLGNERKRPLLQPKLGAFFNPHLRTLGMATKGRKTGDIAAEIHRIIAPVPGRDHPPVKVEDAGQFNTIKGGNRVPIPRPGKGRDDVQALFALG